ncbi:hypothetical protein [Flavobacterium sp. FlaQc-48]|uniref:hypothetical protein n=1 Tax=Flavobacterium sp. FlaQc-48 TaxID=3374181 RepID=UPI0037575A42
METTTLVLNWIASVLLGIEAIRISNFRKLTVHILKFKLAVNPPLIDGNDGHIYLPEAPKGYKIIRKIARIAEVVIGYIIIIIILKFVGKMENVLIFFKSQALNLFAEKWYMICFKIWLSLVLFILVPGLMGASLTILFTKFADKYERFLLKLENNIEKGTIGLIGVILYTVAFIIGLIKINYIS